MFDALYIAATGMQSQQLSVDAIANNLANVNTPGFKKGRISFSDLMVRDNAPAVPGLDGVSAGILGSPRRLGAGVSALNLGKVFAMGDLKKTDSPMDVAIQGDGFIEVLMPDGSSAFTRGGTLKVNKDGLLATGSGYALKSQLAIPDNAETLVVGGDGHVQVRLPNQTDLVEVGQIDLVRFNESSLLNAMGDNLYRVSEASGDPIYARPGELGLGTLVQGQLESSNVKMVDELVSLMLAQRAYEASMKVVQAADEMLGMTNNLRK